MAHLSSIQDNVGQSSYQPKVTQSEQERHGVCWEKNIILSFAGL